MTASIALPFLASQSSRFKLASLVSRGRKRPPSRGGNVFFVAIRKSDVLCFERVVAISNLACVAISRHGGQGLQTAGGQGLFFAFWRLEPLTLLRSPAPE